MAEATREFAIAKTMEILRAYVRKIEAARGYFDCLSPEGCRIVENYDNNVERMFEDKLVELQADMLDICNEYSQGFADKIYIYAANEGMILAQYFYCFNKNVYKCSKLNNVGLKTQFDVSIDCQRQVLNILNKDIQNIQALCEKYNRPVPKLMKITYEPKTKKFNADYEYEDQTSDKVSVFDNYDAWFEEEKAKLEAAEEDL